MVDLSAALRGIPDENHEAAVLDARMVSDFSPKFMGATNLGKTIAVCLDPPFTILVKVFDIVFGDDDMPNGNTSIGQSNGLVGLFNGGGDFGTWRGIAWLLLVLVYSYHGVENIRRANAEMEGR